MHPGAPLPSCVGASAFEETTKPIVEAPIGGGGATHLHHTGEVGQGVRETVQVVDGGALPRARAPAHTFHPLLGTPFPLPLSHTLPHTHTPRATALRHTRSHSPLRMEGGEGETPAPLFVIELHLRILALRAFFLFFCAVLAYCCTTSPPLLSAPPTVRLPAHDDAAEEEEVRVPWRSARFPRRRRDRAPSDHTDEDGNPPADASLQGHACTDLPVLYPSPSSSHRRARRPQ